MSRRCGENRRAGGGGLLRRIGERRGEGRLTGLRDRCLRQVSAAAKPLSSSRPRSRDRSGLNGLRDRRRGVWLGMYLSSRTGGLRGRSRRGGVRARGSRGGLRRRSRGSLGGLRGRSRGSLGGLRCRSLSSLGSRGGLRGRSLGVSRGGLRAGSLGGGLRTALGSLGGDLTRRGVRSLLKGR